MSTELSHTARYLVTLASILLPDPSPKPPPSQNPQKLLFFDTFFKTHELEGPAGVPTRVPANDPKCIAEAP